MKLQEFKKIAKIGSGGYASLYLYEHSKTAQLSVIKKLRPSGRSFSMWEREYSALGKLGGHPKIVEMRDAYASITETIWFELEYCCNGDL
jgi:serine/threonine protein kinase